ncbi:MAG: diadenylate cyclase [Planctomycetaceae bacterium]|nr:diadenylate cyclase [Planctomycetaceae bacterium]
MAVEGTGALIVLPKRQPIDRLLQGGVVVNGQLSVPLLHSIFHSGSQGHDGAVIVRSNRVWKLGVHLPLSTNFEVLGSRGTRHAAALGLAERCDALVLVVSEERGEVSLAENHELTTLADPTQLHEILVSRISPHSSSSRLGVIVPRLFRLLTFGSCAFLITAFFWLLVANPVDQVQRIVDRVPIETHSIPPGWVVESLQPEMIRVNLTGTERAFSAFDWDELRFRLKLKDLEEGSHSVVLSPEGFNLPPEMEVQQIEPKVIYITAYQTEIVELPVSIQIQGSLPEGMQKEQLVPTPNRVSVRVPKRRLSEFQTIPTEAMTYSEIQSNENKEMKLVFPPSVVPIEETPDSVTVQIQEKEARSNESNKTSDQQPMPN